MRFNNCYLRTRHDRARLLCHRIRYQCYNNVPGKKKIGCTRVSLITLYKIKISSCVRPLWYLLINILMIRQWCILRSNVNYLIFRRTRFYNLNIKKKKCLGVPFYIIYIMLCYFSISTISMSATYYYSTIVKRTEWKYLNILQII